MNRPRIVGVLSAVVGSTAGFLVLNRWRLAGTITGAVVVPVIYTIVSHCSHESLVRLWRWARCRASADADPVPAETVPSDETRADLSPTPTQENTHLAARRLHWSVATLAVLALAVSVYALAHSQPGTTILREKVIQTVTVTTEQAKLSVAHRDASAVSADSKLPGSLGASTTTTAPPGKNDLPTSTVSTVAGSGGVSAPPGSQATTTTLR
jgi:hypothetical protein